MKVVKINLVVLLLIACCYSFSQDPHFTQFGDAPLLYNPSYTGVFYKPGQIDRKTKSRILFNFRNQWISTQSPYTTGYFQIDKKLGNQIDGIQHCFQNPFNIGLNCMYDQSLQGAFKTINFTGNMSYHHQLNNNTSIGLGFSAGYVNKRIDVQKISFSQQFSTGGFDLSLPNGETSFSNIKPFFTYATGVLYQTHFGGEDDFSNRIRAGVSLFHLNKPKQTFYNDENEIVPMRFSFQLEYFHEIGAESFYEIKYLQQFQANVNYSMISLNYSKSIGGENFHDNTIGLGINYRLQDAIAPNIYLSIRNYKFMYTYDINSSGLKSGLNQPKSMELSFQYLFTKDED